MARKYGRRGGMSDHRSGTRPVSPTNGTSAHLTGTTKHPSLEATLVDGAAEGLVSQMFDIDPRVKRHQTQGVSVDLPRKTVLLTQEDRERARRHYRGTRGPSIYTPDSAVELHSRQLLAVEVKTDRYGLDPEYLVKLQVAESILVAFGYGFSIVVVPHDRCKPMHSTIALLYQASIREDIDLPVDIADSLDRAHASGARTAADYLMACGLSTRYLPLLLVRGLLRCDPFQAQFNAATPVEPARGDLSHLQLFDQLTQRQ